MGDAQHSTDNGSGNGPWQQPQEPPSLGDHGRQIHHDAEVLATAVRDAADDLHRYVAEQVEQRPLMTLGLAAGAGFVLGGGLSARLTIALLGTATRLATAVAARELSTRILRRGATAAANT